MKFEKQIDGKQNIWTTQFQKKFVNVKLYVLQKYHSLLRVRKEYFPTCKMVF